MPNRHARRHPAAVTPASTPPEPPKVKISGIQAGILELAATLGWPPVNGPIGQIAANEAGWIAFVTSEQLPKRALVEALVFLANTVLHQMPKEPSASPKLWLPGGGR